MRIRTLAAGAFVAPALLLGLAAWAAGEAPADDKDFVRQSVYADTAEIKMAKLALETSSSADVKAFAKHMIADHTKHREETIALAKSMGWDAAAAVTKDDEATLAKLSKLTGKDFDKEYAKVQVKAHEKVLKMNEKWEKDGKEKKVRDAAKKTAAVVRKHLEMAKKLPGNS